MTRNHPLLAALTPALLFASASAAAPEVPPSADAARGKAGGVNISAILKPGTELLGMTVPRYDEQLRLSSVMRSTKVTLVEDGLFEGETIHVRFFEPDSAKCLGDLRLVRGTYGQVPADSSRPALERIRTSGGVVGSSENMLLHASGVHLTIEQPSPADGADADERMEGFLFGPVAIRIAPQPEKNDMKTTMRPLTAAVLVATSVGAPPDAAPPAAPPAAPAPAAESAPATPSKEGAGLRAVLEESEKTTRRVKEYLEMEDLMNRAAETQLQQPEPIEFKAGEKDTVISCDAGAYFDVKTGVVVFMGGVVVNDPRFKASGIDKLEAFFVEKPKEAPKDARKADAKDGAKPADGKASAKWELQRLVATGAVRFAEKLPPGKNDPKAVLPVEASGEVFTYVASGDERPDKATISGGRPWMKRGESAQRAKRMDQTITFTIAKEKVPGQAGEKRSVTLVDFSSDGGWDTYIVTDELPKGK